MRNVEIYIAAWIADEEHRRTTRGADVSRRPTARRRPQCDRGREPGPSRDRDGRRR